MTLLLATGIISQSVGMSQAAQATLSWAAPTTYMDGSPANSIGGYRVYTGTSSDNYTQNIDVGNITSYTLAGLDDATTYYVAVTAYDPSGITSDYSNQISFTTPATPPPAAIYTLTASADSGGSISPPGSIAVSQGMNQTFTISPNSGYGIADVKVDGVSVGVPTNYTFSNIAANHNISASFAPLSTDPASSMVWQNQSIATQSGIFEAGFDMVPLANNMDGVTVLSPVSAQAYTDGASIIRFNPSGNIDVRNGSSYAADVTLPYVAGNSYHVRMRVNVPGKTYDVYVTPAGSSEFLLAKGYSFRTEQAAASTLNYLGIYAGVASHRIFNVSVTPVITYAIAASAGNGGSISPSGSVSVNYGGSQSYAITTASGYRIADVTVDGVSVGAVSNYTFRNVTANHTIAATFAINSYAISTTAGSGGSISPASSVSVNHGSSQTFTITPTTGYRIVDVTVDGVSVGAVSSYTFSNVSANHTISAMFSATVSSYVITSSAGTGGKISPLGTITVARGTSQTYVINSNKRYAILDVQVDGISVGPVMTYTFNEIASNHSIQAFFRRK